MEVAKCYMDEYVVERFPRHSMKELRKLDIWDENFIRSFGLEDPRRMLDKRIHSYLKRTASKKDDLIIKALDKVIKKLY